MGLVADLPKLLAGLLSRGAKFRLEDGKMKVEAPVGVITPDQLLILRNEKKEIERLLRIERFSKYFHTPLICFGCYQLGPKIHIHPPTSSEGWNAWLEQWRPRKRLKQ
jgi:hypothetical protein